jgi:hypothetical protein
MSSRGSLQSALIRAYNRQPKLVMLVLLSCTIAVCLQTGYFGVGFKPRGYHGPLYTAGYPGDKPLWSFWVINSNTSCVVADNNGLDTIMVGGSCCDNHTPQRVYAPALSNPSRLSCCIRLSKLMLHVAQHVPTQSLSWTHTEQHACLASRMACRQCTGHKAMHGLQDLVAAVPTCQPLM